MSLLSECDTRKQLMNVLKVNRTKGKLIEEAFDRTVDNWFWTRLWTFARESTVWIYEYSIPCSYSVFFLL